MRTFRRCGSAGNRRVHLSERGRWIHVDPDGASYITGISGSSSVNDIKTVSFAPDGSRRWSHTFDSGKSGDQARGIARGPGNLLYVVGNTPGPNDFAQVLILIYDATNGTLLNTIKYSSGPNRSEFGSGVVGDAAGNIYVIGGITGDGPDVMTVKFSPAEAVQWRKIWDGTGFPPLDLDAPVKILLDPAGNVLSCITGYMAGGHPDYVVVKYAPTNGARLWQATWGVAGGYFPADMEIDAAGDVYVTGIGIDFIDKYSTIKLRGSDGQLLWQVYDALGLDHRASGLFLDGVGGVFITGASDPDGDHSNFNDDFFTVKRDATTGAQLWTHAYGASCVGCYDVPSDVRVDPAGNVFVAGITSSSALQQRHHSFRAQQRNWGRDQSRAGLQQRRRDSAHRRVALRCRLQSFRRRLHLQRQHRRCRHDRDQMGVADRQ